jgi:hypothetical protein
MMDFLRALAPSDHGAATRATALLPSRFSGVQPLRGKAFTMDTSEASSPVSDVTLVDATPSTSGEQTVRRSERERARVIGPESTRTAAVSPTTQGSERAQSLERRLSASHARHERPAGTAGDVGRDRGDARPSSIQQIVRHRGRETSLARPVVSASLPESAPARPIVQPLSAAALVERPAGRAERRPIVHVTIDRIEVRAPATPMRSTPSERPRATTPRISLGEYLRGPRGAGGAA